MGNKGSQWVPGGASPPADDGSLWSSALVLLLVVGFFSGAYLWVSSDTTREVHSAKSAPQAVATKQQAVGRSTSKEVEWIIVAKRAVRDRLRDADSAKFSGDHVSYFQGVPIACGYVNARNGFGGYSGNVRYIYGGAKIGALLESDMAAGEMNTAWAKLCR